MSDKVTLGSVGNIDNSLLTTINNNNALTTTAINNTLSRDGTSPNQMFANLDMNSFQILNLPAPSSINSPLRLSDIAVFSQPVNIITATTGTTGHVVPFLDGTNTWSAPQNINISALGVGPGFSIGETTGNVTTGSNSSLNSINIVDSLNSGANSVAGFYVGQVMNSSNVQGTRNTLVGQIILNAPTSVSNPNRVYIGVEGDVFANSGDNGTGVTSGTGAGGFTGGKFQSFAGGAATNLLTLNGVTIATTMSAGSSTWSKSGLQIFGSSSDAVAGSGISTMIWLANQNSAVKWNNAILIDNFGGVGSFPIATSGTIIKTSTGTVTNGIDFTATTFSGLSFASNGFSVGGTGSITLGGPGVSSGNINFTGQTSGIVTFGVPAVANQITVNVPLNVGIVGTTAGSINLAGQTSGFANLSCSTTGGTLQLGSGNLTISSVGNLATIGFISATGSIVANNASTLSAGGLSGVGYLFSSTANFGLFFGSGVPTLSAAKGSFYLRSDGTTTATRAYINTDGGTTWTNIVTGA